MVEERNGDYKAEQPEHKVSPLPSPDPFLSPHTCLSLGWALTRLQASGLTEYTLREYRSRNNYTSHTHTVRPTWWWCATLNACPKPGAVHWARPRGKPQYWYVKRARASPQRRKKDMVRSLDEYQNISILVDCGVSDF